MLRPTIGMMPISSVAVKMGDKMNRITIDARIIVIPLTSIETLVLRVS